MRQSYVMHRPQRHGYKGVEHDKHGSNRHGLSGKNDQDRQLGRKQPQLERDVLVPVRTKKTMGTRGIS